MENVKNDIRAHLKKVNDSTVKQLVKVTCHSETDIINALNAMRTFAEVECEQGGRGKGMTYWLSRTAPVNSDTTMPSDKECCNAAKVVATTAGSEVAVLNARIESLEEEIGQRNREIKKLTSDLGHARIQIDALNEQLMAGEDAVDVKDAARGYLVCAPKRKPAKLMKFESAVARAKSAAKATSRCEVFALVPVGVATRKKIRAVEFKERAA
jgi:outer membrane murein-binding lipoprotein Lpp